MTEYQTRSLEEVLDRIPDNSVCPKYSTGIVVYLFAYAVSEHDDTTADLQLENLDDELTEYNAILNEIDALDWIT